MTTLHIYPGKQQYTLRSQNQADLFSATFVLNAARICGGKRNSVSSASLRGRLTNRTISDQPKLSSSRTPLLGREYRKGLNTMTEFVFEAQRTEKVRARDLQLTPKSLEWLHKKSHLLHAQNPRQRTQPLNSVVRRQWKIIRC